MPAPGVPHIHLRLVETTKSTRGSVASNGISPAAWVMVDADHAAHRASVRHQRPQVDPGRGGGGDPCQKRQPDVASPAGGKVLGLHPGLAIAARNRVKSKAHLRRQPGQQEMHRRKAVGGDQDALAVQHPLGKRPQQFVNAFSDALARRGRALRHIDDPPPVIDEILPPQQNIAPLLVIRRGPDFGKRGCGCGKFIFLSRIHANRMIEEISGMF